MQLPSKCGLLKKKHLRTNRHEGLLQDNMFDNYVSDVKVERHIFDATTKLFGVGYKGHDL